MNSKKAAAKKLPDQKKQHPEQCLARLERLMQCREGRVGVRAVVRAMHGAGVKSVQIDCGCTVARITLEAVADDD